MSASKDKGTEVWKQIPGYEGLYEVSNFGRVKRTPHVKTGRNWKCPAGFSFTVKGKMLKPRKRSSGYLQVNLYRNGRMRTHTVHRLVMLAFVGPSDLTVNHENGDKTDNRLENLEYMTAAENARLATARPVESFNPATGQTVKRYRSESAVKSDGFDIGAVNNCCLKKPRYLTHKGLGWRFA